MQGTLFDLIAKAKCNPGQTLPITDLARANFRLASREWMLLVNKTEVRTSLPRTMNEEEKAKRNSDRW